MTFENFSYVVGALAGFGLILASFYIIGLVISLLIYPFAAMANFLIPGSVGRAVFRDQVRRAVKD